MRELPDEDLAEEVREQWTATLQVAVKLLEKLPSFQELARQSPWCRRIAEERSSLTGQSSTAQALKKLGDSLHRLL